MATEPQLRALRNWLNRDIPEGMTICEMPADVCSAALTKLHEASEAYQNGNKNGGIKKAKLEIIADLKEQGWISVPAVAEQKAQSKPELPKKPDVNERFGDRAQAEAQKIREEQGLAGEATEPVESEQPAQPKPSVPELIEKYLNVVVQVTQKVKANEGITDREKGYATNWICDAVKDEMKKGGDRSEEQA